LKFYAVIGFQLRALRQYWTSTTRTKANLNFSVVGVANRKRNIFNLNTNNGVKMELCTGSKI
jgi:hypothetical protein